MKRFVQLSRKLGDVTHIFKRLDVSCNGLVTYAELASGCKKLKLGLEESEVQ